MSVYYFDMIWLAGIVIVMTFAALVGLWRRGTPPEFEPVKPIVLSQSERGVFHQERVSNLQKAQKAEQARKAARKAGRVKRLEALKSRRQAAGTTGSGDVKS